MKELIFATNNPHKLSEIKAILEGIYHVSGLKEKGITEDIPEDHPTLKENALQKAAFVNRRYGYDCFADDTGLIIDALGGEPGVYSARYSRMGTPVYPDMEVAAANIRKVLEKLEGKTDRSASFVTVIALILKGRTHYFTGKVDGTITETPSGTDGFGYDPIFIPRGYSRTFAEMSMTEKNRISHRARAVDALSEFLKRGAL